jgi:hypothetical protein
MNGQAETAIEQAVAQESEEAPQKEIARLKKEADDLETQRQSNLKTFRPRSRLSAMISLFEFQNESNGGK